jgi:hypothetical protein
MIYAYIRIGKAKDILANIKAQQSLLKLSHSEKQPLMSEGYPTGKVCLALVKGED